MKGIIADYLQPSKNRDLAEWTLDQMNIRPYQQILEINYGNGSALQETARRLKVGFLAGIDPSPEMYQLAYKRNKRFVSNQLLQLHLGEMQELPYPSHYFHTIYGINVDFLRKDPQPELFRLAALLKNGGRLVLVFRSRRGETASDIRTTAEKLETGCLEAGLTDIRVETQDRYPATYIAATAFKI